MSGGHYEYRYNQIMEIAFQIKNEAEETLHWEEDCEVIVPRDPEEVKLRKNMANFLAQVSEACRALEWLDSGDSSDFEQVVEMFKKCRFRKN